MRRNTARASARAWLFPGWTGLIAMSALALAACGGGGDGGSGSAAPASTTTTTTTTTTNAPAAPAPLQVSGLDQDCSGCGAATASSYGGAGTGIWGRATSGSDMDVQYAISGVAGRSISLMLTNLSSVSLAMPASISSNMVANMLSPQALSAVSDAEATQRAIGEFNRAGWVDALQRGASAPMLSTQSVAAAAPLSSTIGLTTGATKSWYHSDGTWRPATMRTQMTASDGVKINFWVEDAEFSAGHITQAMVDGLAATYAGTGGIYDRLVGIGGPVWGANSYATSLLPAGQPVDIVILNFNRDNQPFGTIGYFWSMHNFLQSAAPNSNQAISLYMDSETMSLGGTPGMQSIRTVMAHESTHMQNFYRRQVSMGPAYAYDTWLEEMTAMQMEDFQSNAIDPTYNPIRDVRLPDFYRYNDYNCNLLQFTGFGATCESYAVSGSFGGFLNRQLGLAFYKDLLTRTAGTSKDVLDQAIRAAQSGWTFEQALLNWKVTTTTAMPAASAPAGFGYPSRTDGTYTLPAIDPSLPGYAALRKLPAAAPSFLQGYGTYAAARSDSNGVYSDKVRVPAGAALSVVVY